MCAGICKMIMWVCSGGQRMTAAVFLSILLPEPIVDQDRLVGH